MGETGAPTDDRTVSFPHASESGAERLTGRVTCLKRWIDEPSEHFRSRFRRDVSVDGGDQHFGLGTCKFESSKAPKHVAKSGFAGGVNCVISTPWISALRKKKQLRALRGELGVFGEGHLYVLVLLVGDSGGVIRPEPQVEAS